MTRRSSRTEKPAPVESELQVTPEEGRIVNQESSAPVNLEVETPSEEPVVAPEATPTSVIQTDVREKLSKKSVEENVFIPANPVALEKAAAQVAQDSGFELTRGTSIGARLIARAQKRV
jgi:hypothetical protein